MVRFNSGLKGGGGNSVIVIMLCRAILLWESNNWCKGSRDLLILFI